MRKILFVHNFYQQSGGEDKVIEQEMSLLKSKGDNVELYSVHNDAIRDLGIIDKARVALSTAWSVDQYKNFKKRLMDMKPDVVHVHNFFPLISPSIYYACHNAGIPIVQTLHNYRLICPAATFMRDGKICEDCLSGGLINSIKHGCYRGSKLQTTSVATMIKLNHLIGTWRKKVSRYIVLTDFAKSKFIVNGFPQERLIVKPNFMKKQEEASVTEVINTGDYMLFVGRLSVEKGVKNLLVAWSGSTRLKDKKLIIIGDGPLKAQLAAQFENDHIKFLGSQNTETVLTYMKFARYLIVPSIWYEGFPMTIVESYSVGTPVICSNIGSLQEVVEDGHTGYHFQYDSTSDLKSVIEKAFNNDDYNKLRMNVNEVFNRLYTDQVNYEKLKSIYQEVIEENINERNRKISIR